MKNQNYDVFGISVDGIRNKNELRVIKAMRELIPQFPDFDYCSICIQDVYALSLNQLTPKYMQSGTIVLRKEFSEADFKDVVEGAIEKVLKQKNHP